MIVQKYVFVLLLFSLGLLRGNCQDHKSLKVLTYNIWNGFDWGKDVKRAANFQAWMKNRDLDVAALQELCDYSEERLSREAFQWGHEYSALLKTRGYSVGLTSKYPIEIVEKITEGMHHGALHARTNGVDFIVVHLHPASVLKRREEVEILSKKIRQILKSTEKLLVLGDFNAFSPFDKRLYPVDGKMVRELQESDGNKGLDGNLDNNNPDYSVISAILSVPLYDLTAMHTGAYENIMSFPTPALIPRYISSVEEAKELGQRIDFIFASSWLSEKCRGVDVLNEEENWHLSDHYPVQAIFEW